MFLYSSVRQSECHAHPRWQLCHEHNEGNHASGECACYIVCVLYVACFFQLGNNRWPSYSCLEVFHSFCLQNTDVLCSKQILFLGQACGRNWKYRSALWPGRCSRMSPFCIANHVCLLYGIILICWCKREQASPHDSTVTHATMRTTSPSTVIFAGRSDNVKRIGAWFTHDYYSVIETNACSKAKCRVWKYGHRYVLQWELLLIFLVNLCTLLRKFLKLAKLTGKSVKLLKFTEFRLCVRKRFSMHSIVSFIKIYTKLSCQWMSRPHMRQFFLTIYSIYSIAHVARRLACPLVKLGKLLVNLRNFRKFAWLS